ncbi:MAG: hypothetical protein ABI876_08630 [Bacteroidota bacterium]
MHEALLTYVFRAIEVLVLALGSMVWWQVRNADRLLENVATDLRLIREQQVKVDTLVGVMQREMVDLRVQMDRIGTRLSDVETRATSLGERINSATGHASSGH